MSPDDITNAADLARASALLGERWGLERSLSPAEMGRLLRLRGRPASRMGDYARGVALPGPLCVAVALLLDLPAPPPWADFLRPVGRPRKAVA